MRIQRIKILFRSSVAYLLKEKGWSDIMIDKRNSELGEKNSKKPLTNVKQDLETENHKALK